MSKKAMKIISVLTIILCVIMTATTVCFADVSFENMSNTNLNTTAENKMENIGGNIIAILRNVGMILAVIIVMVLGIKYMMGSAQEKAEYKKTMIPYVVGAVLLFGASAIAQMVISFAHLA